MSDNVRGSIIDGLYISRLDRPINDDLDVSHSPFIGVRKDITDARQKQEEEKAKSSKKSNKGSKKDDKDLKHDKSHKDKPEESSTGTIGTEIGLPIDKENCESTSIAGISTPTTPLNPRSKKKIQEAIDRSVKRYTTDSSEPTKSWENPYTHDEEVVDDTKDLTIVCPKCKAQFVNTHNFGTLHCSQCGYEWELEDIEYRDEALNNTEDIPPLLKNFITNVSVIPQTY